MATGSPEALSLYNKGVDQAQQGDEAAAAACWHKALGFEPQPGLEVMIRRNLVVAYFRPLREIPDGTTLSPELSRSFRAGHEHWSRLVELSKTSLTDLDENVRGELSGFIHGHAQTVARVADGDWILVGGETALMMYQAATKVANEGRKSEALPLMVQAVSVLDGTDPQQREMLKTALLRCAALSSDLGKREEALEYADRLVAEFQFSEKDPEYIVLSGIFLTYRGRMPEALDPAAARKGGCFIATVATGSASSSEVRALRAFRDQALLRRPAGRLLVALYEAVSPSLARSIAGHGWLRRLTLVAVVRPAVWLVHRTRVGRRTLAG